MKKIFIFALAASSLLGAASCNGNSTSSNLKTPSDSLSYYFGEMWGNGVGGELTQGPDSAKLNKASFIKGLEISLLADTSNVSYSQGLAVGSQLVSTFQQIKKQNNVDIDPKIVLDAFKKAFLSDSIKSPQEAQTKVMALMQKISEENKAKSPEAIANKKAGEAFINDAMKKDATIKKTESGLAYKEVTPGKGAKFTATDKVKVKYTGKHIDGKEFDASGDTPRSFSPMAVVPGFKEGLLMMSPGAKYILYIPGDLAYGVEGQPMGGIAPNETLVFEVETIGIDDAQPAQPAK